MNRCRVCDGPVREFIDFGRMPRANGFIDPGKDDGFFYRLAVGVCQKCWLVQLIETLPSSILFGQDYPFFTSSSQKTATHFRILAGNLVKQYNPKFILEIGGNDGTFLSNFRCRRLNIEPGAQWVMSHNKGIDTIREFASPRLLANIKNEYGIPDIVFASNCFCHIPNLIEILVTLAGWDTTIIFEDPYLGSIIEGVTYDQFYDEHVFYFGVNSVSNMAQKVGLALVDVVRLPVHGGSIRYTLRKSDQVFNHNELWANQNRVYDSLSSAIRQSKNRLIGGIRGIENLAGYGATSKSTTILNYCGLDWRRIKYIVDSTPQKQGKLTPGSHIPIVSPEFFKDNPPDACINFAWNHWTEIIHKEEWFKNWIHPHKLA